jgi:acyl-CoA thioester hydrolase
MPREERGDPMTDAYTFRHRVEIRFSDCDAMQHVNNAVYFTYAEQARVAFWRTLVGGHRLEDINFIIARAECDYRSPATVGDLLEVRLRVSGLGRSSFTFEYAMVDAGGGRVFATARTVQVMYDYERRAPMPLPSALRARLEAYRVPAEQAD